MRAINPQNTTAEPTNTNGFELVDNFTNKFGSVAFVAVVVTVVLCGSVFETTKSLDGWFVGLAAAVVEFDISAGTVKENTDPQNRQTFIKTIRNIGKRL